MQVRHGSSPNLALGSLLGAPLLGGALAFVVGPLGRAQEPVPEPEQAAALAFEVADYDASGWIGFEEASESLRLDRTSFFAYDTDRDGRITPQEYSTRYFEVLARVGTVPAPVPRAEPDVVPLRNAEQLRIAYDADSDGRLDLPELKAFVEDYGLEDEPAVASLRKLDVDQSGGLELPEIERLAKLLETFTQSPLRDLGVDPAESIEELFGTPIERDTRSSIPEPARIEGPVPSFVRLDLDRDGAVTVEDLAALQFPLVLPVRPQAVLAALDANADGRLSPAELRAALE